ncbi:MAG TPA: PQQ-binding-like beta-propeller repeat protein [Verrucomicrobiota bacterium]|nr:PQQ-binding-like beta-propeller repeat protein [Verrucomicrobiota bacterium]
MRYAWVGVRWLRWLLHLAVINGLLRADQPLPDWPMLRGNACHNGYAQVEVRSAYHRAWAVEFENERLGTAAEPIVARGRLYVATHAGNVYAIDAVTGDALWRFDGGAPFLQSPAVSSNVVVAADTAGRLFGLDASSGEVRWVYVTDLGGCSAAPVLDGGVAFIGTRQGDMLAVNAIDGREHWRRRLGSPIRQTAAVAEGLVFVTTEALHVVAMRASTGELVWESKPLSGQSARDYYPVLIRRGDRAYVIVRTNPAHNFADRINRDRRFLAAQANVDDSHWQKLDAWHKSEAARGTPELLAREQAAVAEYVATNQLAQTFFMFDARSGREIDPAPILWAAGCQGVGAPPAMTIDGRLLVLFRTAYGNWNLGVAPMVALGMLDPELNRVQLLFHRHGFQPPWNTFWGTADESLHFLVASNKVLIVHQGTLSAFDLVQSNLVTIHGERDTYGGLRNPPWARNEWHGPGRGGVALAGNRIYWQTGSRVLCLAPGKSGSVPPVRVVRSDEVKTIRGPAPSVPTTSMLRAELGRSIGAFLSARWAPLMVEPGLAGRQFFFDNTGAVLEALSWAYPHLETNQQAGVLALLANEFERRPPYTAAGQLDLNEGQRREWSPPPAESLSRVGADQPPHPFAGVYAAWFYGQRCGQTGRVLERWPDIRGVYREFVATGWKLDAAKGDLHANRYMRSLLVIQDLARKTGDHETFADAQSRFESNFDALAGWWKRVGSENSVGTFNGAAELDRFIGGGNGLFLRIAPHRHKVWLLDGLSPELAARIRERAILFCRCGRCLSVCMPPGGWLGRNARCILEKTTLTRQT